jgi:hypothetical protein
MSWPRTVAQKLLSWLATAVWFLCRALLVTWGTLAIYYSNLPWSGARFGLAIAFAAFMIWAFWFSRRLQMQAMAFALFFGVVAWWIAIPASHHRNWRPEVAVLPRATIDGDRVRITGVRNFDYRTLDDFVVRYEEREVQLSHLVALDFYVSYFTEGPVAHTFVSFIFEDAPPLSISIETRPEMGEGFAPIASIFKQFELIYVVGDERDIVGVRAIHRGEPIYLYRLNTSPADTRRLFLVYLERINELADRPEFYNLFTNSCTINIVRYANAAGRRGALNIRHILNGLVDGYLYYSGRMNATIPFDELRRRSRINEAAREANGRPDFSDRIRSALPTVSH